MDKIKHYLGLSDEHLEQKTLELWFKWCFHHSVNDIVAQKLVCRQDLFSRFFDRLRHEAEAYMDQNPNEKVTSFTWTKIAIRVLCWTPSDIENINT